MFQDLKAVITIVRHFRLFGKQYYLRLQTKLRQGNVFTGVCLLTGGEVAIPGPMSFPGGVGISGTRSFPGGVYVHGWVGMSRGVCRG